MNTRNDTFERAMKLAVVCGLRAAMGPALVSAAQRRPEAKTLAMAAVAETLIDKLPLVPSRSSLPLLLPRAFAGYWVTQKMMERDGVQDQWAAPMGAAVAAGVATLAPMIRRTLRTVLGLPDFAVGLGEDYLAASLGSQAVGMTVQDVQGLAREAVSDIQGAVLPAVEPYMPQALQRQFG